MFNPVGVILLGTYYNQKSGVAPACFRQYLSKSLPAIACILIGSLLLNMDSYTNSFYFIDNPEMYSPTMQIIEGIKVPY